MAVFNAQSDTPAGPGDLAAADKFVYGRVSPSGWETMLAGDVFDALVRVTSGGRAGALNLVLPTQTGQAGKFLQTDGTDAAWTSVSVPVTSVAGRTGDVTLAVDDVSGAARLSGGNTFTGQQFANVTASPSGTAGWVVMDAGTPTGRWFGNGSLTLYEKLYDGVSLSRVVLDVPTGSATLQAVKLQAAGVAADAGLARYAGGVLKATDGSTGLGDLRLKKGIFQYASGTAGTHEVQTYHDGTDGYIESKSGGLNLVVPDNCTVAAKRSDGQIMWQSSANAGGQNRPTLFQSIADLDNAYWGLGYGTDGLRLGVGAGITFRSGAYYNAAETTLTRNTTGTAGGLYATTTVTGADLLTLQFPASATGNGLNVKNSTGTSTFRVTKDGYVEVGASAGVYWRMGDGSLTLMNTGASVSIDSAVAGGISTTAVRLAGNYLYCGYSGTVGVHLAGSAGNFDTALSRNSSGTAGGLHATTTVTGADILTLQGPASQTGNFLTLKNSVGTGLWGVAANGVPYDQSNITRYGHEASADGFCTAIGSSCGAAGASTAVGHGASATNTSLALGIGARSWYDHSIALGHDSTTTAANQLVAGTSTNPVNKVYIGYGVTSATPGDTTYAATGGSGTNVAGGSLILAGGLGTGNATPGAVVFKAGTAGSSGSSLQSLTTRMTVGGTGSNFYAGASTEVPVTINLAASQTANALEVKNSVGTTLTSIDPNGTIHSPATGQFTVGNPANVGIGRYADGVLKVTDGSTGLGDIRLKKGIFQYASGTPGTHEVQTYHDGSNGYVECLDGEVRLKGSGFRFVRSSDGGTIVSWAGDTINLAGYTVMTAAYTDRINLGPQSVEAVVIVYAAANIARVRGAGGGGAAFAFQPVSPAQITSDQNNYAPGVARNYRLSTDASRTLTGLSVGQADGYECRIFNAGSNDLILANQSASSTAANRFLTHTGADLTLTANQSAGLVYDATTARWRTHP